jgi:hypothetical protein
VSILLYIKTLVYLFRHFRATGNDEMCNFYIMFYTDASVARLSTDCGGVQYQDLVDNMPADSDVTLPPNPLLDEEAHGHHHHHSMAGSSATDPAGPEPTMSGHDHHDHDHSKLAACLCASLTENQLYFPALLLNWQEIKMEESK